MNAKLTYVLRLCRELAFIEASSGPVILTVSPFTALRDTHVKVHM